MRAARSYASCTLRGETYTTGDILPVFVQSFEEPQRERRGRDEDEPQRYDFTSDQALNIDTETGSPLSTLRHGEGDALLAQTMATFTCSRRAPELVSGLISQVVPEVDEELVRIVGVAREPGKFTKVAIDVGTSGGTATAAVRLAVGVDGVHARRLRELLQGEQVLFVEYDADPQAYLRNAMDRFWHTDDRSAVSAVLVYNDARTGESIGVVAAKPGKGAAMVGAGAANVRTASDLTGMRLTVVEEEEFEEIMKERDEREARRAEASWRVHAGGRFANAGGEGEDTAVRRDGGRAALQPERRRRERRGRGRGRRHDYCATTGGGSRAAGGQRGIRRRKGRFSAPVRPRCAAGRL